MKPPEGNVLTPLYVAAEPDDTHWPDDPVFYVLASNGLYLCRNNPLFRSSVPAPDWPSELAPHHRFLELRCPRIPQRQFELILGFFLEIAVRHSAEAAALLLWDRDEQRMKFAIPRQQATVYESWSGSRSPRDVQYQIPDLPESMIVIGDVHSHVDGPAYASSVDRGDEKHRAGLHIVVGRIFRLQPEYYCAFVVDGMRFKVDPPSVLGTHHEPAADIPRQWLDRIEVRVDAPDERARYYDRRVENDSRRPRDLTSRSR